VSGGTAPGLFEGLGDRLGEAPADARTEDPLRERLRAVDIDTLTPLEALKLLSDLKNET
jgi:hypothetical protein